MVVKAVDFHTLLGQLYAVNLANVTLVKIANVTLVKGEHHTSKWQTSHVMFCDDLSLSGFT